MNGLGGPQHSGTGEPEHLDTGAALKHAIHQRMCELSCTVEALAEERYLYR